MSNSGTILGRVTDPTGAVIAGAFGAITSQDVPRSWQMSLNVSF